MHKEKLNIAVMYNSVHKKTSVTENPDPQF